MQMANQETDKVQYLGTGRRKRSIARVVLTKGTGEITINNTPVSDFFPYSTLVQDLTQGLDITGTRKLFNISIKVKGGGFSGQAGACRLGIARALLKVSADYRSQLKAAKLLTRDARIKERKKYGLKKARRAPQFSKR